jgi:hypothetical protein
MKKLARLPSLLLVLNWLLFAIAFVLTCKAQGNVLWWLRIDWSAWLSAYGAMTQMADIPAGSVWVMWALASVALTMLMALQPAAVARPVMQQEPALDARRQLVTQPGIMDERPELKEKILKLHQSLERL